MLPKRNLSSLLCGSTCVSPRTFLHPIPKKENSLLFLFTVKSTKRCSDFTLISTPGLNVVRLPSLPFQWQFNGTHRTRGGPGGGTTPHNPPPVSRRIRPHIIRRVHSPNDDSQQPVMWFPGLFILQKPTKSSTEWEAQQQASAL